MRSYQEEPGVQGSACYHPTHVVSISSLPSPSGSSGEPLGVGPAGPGFCKPAAVFWCSLSLSSSQWLMEWRSARGPSCLLIHQGTPTPGYLPSDEPQSLGGSAVHTGQVPARWARCTEDVGHFCFIVVDSPQQMHCSWGPQRASQGASQIA